MTATVLNFPPLTEGKRASLGNAVDPVTFELNYTSPSALAKFNPQEEGGCQRRWWFRYRERLPEPTTVDQQIGIEGHSQVEHYSTTGEDVLGVYARAGKHLLHPPSRDLLVETPVTHLFADQLKVVGFMDSVNPTGKYVSPQGELMSDPPGTVEVIDNKFIKDLQWAKTGDQLFTTQMVGYGEDIRLRFNSEFVRLSHIYFQKKARGALKSSILVPAEDIKQRWMEKGHQIVPQMRSVAKLSEFKDVPMNESACSTFGGCPFRSKCFTNPLQRLKASIGNSMSLLDKIRAQKNGAGQAVIPPSAVIPPPSSAVSASPTAATAAAAVQNQLYVLPNGLTSMFLCAVGGKYSFISVDASGMPNGAPVMLDKDVPVFPAAPAVSFATPAPTQTAPVVTTPPPPVQVAPPPMQETKRGPGRPPKIKIEDKSMPTAASTTMAAPTAVAATTAPTGLRLYVNAIPNAPHVTLDAYVMTKAKILAEEFKLTDIRFQPNGEHPLAFGRWKGALASLVRNEPPANGTYVVFTRGNELAEVVVEALSGLCGEGCLTRGI